MRRPSYLILHGYEGSGPGHWQTWVAGRLRSGEATVAYPDLPDAEHPQLQTSLDALARRALARRGPPPPRALAGRAGRRARRARRAAGGPVPLARLPAVAAPR